MTLFQVIPTEHVLWRNCNFGKQVSITAIFQMEMVRNVINMQEIINKFIPGSCNNWQSNLFFFHNRKRKPYLETGKSKKTKPNKY